MKEGEKEKDVLLRGLQKATVEEGRTRRRWPG